MIEISIPVNGISVEIFGTLMEEKEKNTPKEGKEEIPAEVVKKEKKSSSFKSKILTIGLPAFVVEVLVIYFVTANVLMMKVDGMKKGGQNTASITTSTDSVQNSQTSDLGKYIFTIDDVIVNPEGTDGKRLLLVSVGFDLGNEENKTELKNKEVMVKDAIISVLSGMTLPQLSALPYKDTIKVDLMDRVKRLMPDIQLNTVYLSKYIIQ